MSLRNLLAKGIEVTLATDSARADLDRLIADASLPADAAEHVRHTLEAMPGLLGSIYEALSDPTAPPPARSLFNAVVAYLLEEDDLIPTHSDSPMLGMLDDLYLLHRAALEIASHLGRVDMRSIAGGAQLLESLLPAEVVEELERKIKMAARG